MACKAKAKRPGRPRAAKGALREVRSVRLPAALWKRIEAYGKITAIIEQALTIWLDRAEYRKSLTDNQ